MNYWKVSLALILTTALSSAQPTPRNLFDGRSYLKAMAKTSSADASLVKAEVRKCAQQTFLKKRLSGLAGNFEEDFKVCGSASGAFTRPGARQQAVLYRYSYTNGVVVLERGKVAAHYSGDPGDYAHYLAIAAAPDINQNGCSELILFRNVEDSSEIFAYLFERSTYLGAATVFESNQRAGDEPVSDEKIQAYVASVLPAKQPTFQHTVYQKGKGNSWSLVKPATPFALDKKTPAELVRIDGGKP